MRCSVCSCRAGAAPAPRRARHPQHIRHGHRAFEQPASDVLTFSQPPLPERALRPTFPCSLRRARSSSVPSAARISTRRPPRSWRSTHRVPAQSGSGTGIVRTVDLDTLVPDDSLTIDGAVAPWNSLMWSLMTDICRQMGVRTDVPFRDLTKNEKGHRLPRPRGEEAHLLPQQEFQPGGRAGLHLLQRRLYRRKRTRQG